MVREKIRGTRSQECDGSQPSGMKQSADRHWRRRAPKHFLLRYHSRAWPPVPHSLFSFPFFFFQLPSERSFNCSILYSKFPALLQPSLAASTLLTSLRAQVSRAALSRPMLLLAAWSPNQLRCLNHFSAQSLGQRRDDH